MTEIELEFSLDTEGRTTSTTKSENPTTVDYNSKTVLTSLAEMSPDDGLIDDLLFDCEITDCALLPRTFWMPSTGKEPRCALEQCALEVFHHHVNNKSINYDPKTSGAEWWVQIRPSPPAGRYTLLCGTDNASDDDESEEKKGICFHWDKDEDLRLMMDGKMYIHPHLSTVTYLTSLGAPTMVVNQRVNNFTGDYLSVDEANVVDAYISWPKQGKHLSFDGRFLHGGPHNIMEDGIFEAQTTITQNEVNDQTQKKKIERRHRRVTFLVNIWLNHKPFNVEFFPESMIEKLSKPKRESHILFDNENSCKNQHEICTVETVIDKGKSDKLRIRDTDFQWALGDGSEERIEMRLPLEMIRSQMQDGGNACIHWECSKDSQRMVRIVREKSNEKRERTTTSDTLGEKRQRV